MPSMARQIDHTDHKRTPPMTTLYITVGDREQLREDALEFVRDSESTDLEAENEMATLQFGSYDDLVESLTPLRLELVRAIVEHEPESMRETARLADRDISDVHTDLKHLEVLGILGLEQDGPHGAMRPIVPFDRIEVHIDYPLLESLGTDSASAQA